SGMTVSTREADAAFADLICADPQWLDAEFDALIAESFGEPPAQPPPAPPRVPPSPGSTPPPSPGPASGPAAAASPRTAGPGHGEVVVEQDDFNLGAGQVQAQRPAGLGGDGDGAVAGLHRDETQASFHRMRIHES